MRRVWHSRATSVCGRVRAVPLEVQIPSDEVRIVRNVQWDYRMARSIGAWLELVVASNKQGVARSANARHIVGQVKYRWTIPDSVREAHEENTEAIELKKIIARL